MSPLKYNIILVVHLEITACAILEDLSRLSDCHVFRSVIQLQPAKIIERLRLMEPTKSSLASYTDCTVFNTKTDFSHSSLHFLVFRQF